MTRSSFDGSRLRLARLFNGFTTSTLGERVDVSHSFIVQLESGTRTPSDSLLCALGEQLGFAPDFFLFPVLDEFREDNVFFRRRKTTPVGVRSKALTHGTLFGFVVNYLDKAIGLPRVNLPSFKVTDRASIEKAAELAREYWELGLSGPIVNMVRVLEWSGVVATQFFADADKIDAFSKTGDRNIVVLNMDKSAPSRTRYDAAHECGHLVMHDGQILGDDAHDSTLEVQADQFAAAFLLPRLAFAREFPRTQRLHWPSLISMKQRWKVSLAAIIRRAYDLQLITATEYQRAYKYLSVQGWRKKEPYEFELESPETFRLALNKLAISSGIYPYDVARKLNWSPDIFEQVTGVSAPKPEPMQTTGEIPQSAEIISLDRYRS